MERPLAPVKIFIAITACTFLLLGGSLADEQDGEQKLSETLVHTQNGPVQGTIKSSRNPSIEFVSFVGLRYVEKPARFEPAKPLEATWSTPKVANVPGNNCPQMTTDIKKWDVKEDCLFLNVYVPKSHLEGESTKKLSILVWTHGGAFSFGDGTNYGPEYFMETEDVILVTINYRLGLLGFITMEDDDAFTANNGLRDCVMALKWVQENIAAFKGDPDKVTIAGNSAGSAIVHYLLMSPLAKGLFHGAIMQSGALAFWSYAPNPRKEALIIANFLKCNESEEAQYIRKCIEGKTPKQILIAQFLSSPRWPGTNPVSRFLPTAKEPQDNAFFSGEPSSFFTFHGQETKYASNVPVMAGVVRDEGSTLFTAFVISDDELVKEFDTTWDFLAPKTFCYEGHFLDRRLPWISKRLREYYFDKTPLTKEATDILTSMYSDADFLLPVMYAAGDMAKSGIQVWPFVFNYLSDWSVRKALQLPDVPGTIGHADELQYLFPHPMLGAPLQPDSDPEKFSKRLVKFWTSFVKNGVPASEWIEGEPLNWNPIPESKDDAPLSKFDVLSIDSNSKVVSTFEFSDRLQFWRDTLKKAVGAGNKNKSQGKTEL